MSEHQPRDDRDWAHWPGRRQPDDRIRHRLKALFSSSEHGADEVEALIAQRGRELEERTGQLAATIADLERREESTRRDRVALEEMLRRGSAELDERQADLNALAAELAAREAEITAVAEDVEERRRELGAVELRRAAVERREAAIQDRESAIEHAAAALSDRERESQGHTGDVERRIASVAELEARISAEQSALAAREAKLTEAVTEMEGRFRELTAAQAALAEERERYFSDLAERERELERARLALAEREIELEAAHEALEASRGTLAHAASSVSGGLDLPPGDGTDGAEYATHVVFVSGDRYRLDERAGTAPAPGSVVDADGDSFVVLRVGPSPLPGDRRRCAFLEPLDFHASSSDH